MPLVDKHWESSVFFFFHSKLSTYLAPQTPRLSYHHPDHHHPPASRQVRAQLQELICDSIKH